MHLTTLDCHLYPYDGMVCRSYHNLDSDAIVERTLPSSDTDSDLENGPQLRFDAYKAAWTRCLDRVKSIIAELYNPVVSAVSDRMNNIHADVLPGLPFPELPVITIADLAGGSVFLDHLSGRIEEMRPSRTEAYTHFVSAYDLNLLQYGMMQPKPCIDPRPSLIVFLHAFEQFDANVVQDMFYICRQKLMLHQTFFDPSFDLHLLPGPTLLEYFEDYYTTHNPSLDALITLLQLLVLGSSFLPGSAPETLRHRRVHLPFNNHTPYFGESDGERAGLPRGAIRPAVRGELKPKEGSGARRPAHRTYCSKQPTLSGRRSPMHSTDEGCGRKLPSADRDALLESVETYLDDNDMSGIPRPESDNPDVADLLETFLTDLLQPLETSTALWSVWYTGFTPFPSEMLNPALRSSIFSGLSFPHAYTGQNLVPEDEESLEDLPDTSILFKGYVKAGKMINIYDWFDHFRTVLEGQRARAAKGKGKGKKTVNDEGMEDDRWQLSVQARFMRALHELDYLGLIKHTGRGGGGRKGEYVLRTVLGVLE
ncbi:hypothetical protein B0H12DRAFT_1071502 [Mycena haematopus]|nr:hypothetical protein B0H12DRAFT_1071502 [Mycena haematopus]